MSHDAGLISSDTLVTWAALACGALVFLRLMAGARRAIVKQAEAEEEARALAEKERREAEQGIMPVAREVV